ncbi:MAG TPA: hypothetical protein VKR06_42730 [Ktedonosporobacter sp.]|nr:hypothetical protein [Ktedonosporobacter sp.]
MKQSDTMAPIKVILTLDKLNNAKHLYDETADEEEKQQAGRIFADCYDWLIEQQVAIHYDKVLHIWLYGGQYHNREKLI